MIVVPSMECGGVEKNVSLICNNIDTSKFDVSLVILDNSRQFFHITNAAIRIIDLKIPTVRRSIFALTKLSRKLKPDIILAAANHLNLFLGIFKWLFPKRIKLIARESSIVSINDPSKWNFNFYSWLCRNFYKNLDLIICQSLFMKNDLVQHFNVPARKTYVINNPVEIPQPAPSLRDEDSEGEPVFITVGRLSKEKGLERILRSLAKLKTSFTYHIIGEGDRRPSLEKIIREQKMEGKVFLPGKFNRPFAQVPDPTLFLMGSYFEGFPNGVLEANALGIPVVAYPAPGGISELIRNYENGILSEGEKEEDFTRAIEKALNHSFDHARIRLDNKARYDLKKVIHQWEALLEAVHAGKLPVPQN